MNEKKGTFLYAWRERYFYICMKRKVLLCMHEKKGTFIYEWRESYFYVCLKRKVLFYMIEEKGTFMYAWGERYFSIWLKRKVLLCMHEEQGTYFPLLFPLTQAKSYNSSCFLLVFLSFCFSSQSLQLFILNLKLFI